MRTLTDICRLTSPFASTTSTTIDPSSSFAAAERRQLVPKRLEPRLLLHGVGGVREAQPGRELEVHARQERVLPQGCDCGPERDAVAEKRVVDPKQQELAACGHGRLQLLRKVGLAHESYLRKRLRYPGIARLEPRGDGGQDRDPQHCAVGIEEERPEVLSKLRPAPESTHCCDPLRTKRFCLKRGFGWH